MPYVNLETRYACYCIVRSTNFGRVVGESGQVFSGNGSGIRKQGAGKLHSITGVSYKLNNRIIPLNDVFDLCLIHSKRLVKFAAKVLVLSVLSRRLFTNL